MASRLDKNAVLILLISTVLVATGLVPALISRDVRLIAAMVAIAGALIMGFVQARRVRRAASRR